MNVKNRRWVVASLLAVSGALLSERPASADFLVTPWTGSSPQPRQMTSGNGLLVGYSGAEQPVFLNSAGTGTYQLTFKNTPYSTSKVSAHITAVGVPGASCIPYYAVRSGVDFFMNVACVKGGQPINTRFAVDLTQGTGSWSGRGRAIAREQSNSLTSETWSSSGQAPTLQHPSIGSYTFTFPGLSDTSSGGNAQAIATSYGKHCSLTSWGTFSGASTISVTCYDANDALSDSDVMVSFEQLVGADPQVSKGMIWADQPSYAGTYTPNAFWNRGAGSTSVTPTAMSVTRTGTGRYLVDLGVKGTTQLNGNTGIHTQITPWGSTATCAVLDEDVYSVIVSCSNRLGAPVDSSFSLLYTNQNTYFERSFRQITTNGTNFRTVFDVGNGLACGTGPAFPGVDCVLPQGKFTTSGPLPIVNGTMPLRADGVSPVAAKSIAISSVDATATTVFMLGDNDVLYATTGTLGPTWDPANNFKTWSVYSQPIAASGSTLSFKKIIAVRSTNAQGVSSMTVMGLAYDGKTWTQRSAGMRWSPYALLADSSTFTDISHGRDDVYAIRSDQTMWVSSLSDSTFSQLPALPNGLLPIAIGGRYVMTNAGKTSGKYPCTAPKDSWGNYVCAGSAQRLYRIMLDRTWFNLLDWPMTPKAEPATYDADVLRYGDPLASYSPTVIDGETFDGSFGAAFVWHLFTRMYQLAP